MGRQRLSIPPPYDKTIFYRWFTCYLWKYTCGWGFITASKNAFFRVRWNNPRHPAIYGGREDIGVGVKTKPPLSGNDGRRPAQYYHAAPGNKQTHPVSATPLAPWSVCAGVGVVVVLVAAAALLAPWNVCVGIGIIVVVDQPEGVYFQPRPKILLLPASYFLNRPRNYWRRVLISSTSKNILLEMVIC
jgi:hypothetical protein